MRVALTGLPGAGVKTVFSAITGLGTSASEVAPSFGSLRVSVLQVPDPRLTLLSDHFQPRKTVPSAVEIVEFPGLFGEHRDAHLLAKCRESEALALVVRSFQSSAMPHPLGAVDPERDLKRVEVEMMLSDLQIVETRVQKLEAGLGKRKDADEQRELEVLQRCQSALEDELPLRKLDLSEQDLKSIRGFSFLTLKPCVVLLNIGEQQLESQDSLFETIKSGGYATRAICGDLEFELARLSAPDRQEMMAEFGIEELAAPVVLQAIFQALDLVTFFTYGEDECRAWTISRGQTALDAAARIHTDLAAGFIRAEVVSFGDFEQLGSIKAVKAAGKFRLEGKDYEVQDGDLIIIRHSR